MRHVMGVEKGNVGSKMSFTFGFLLAEDQRLKLWRLA